MYLCIVTHMCLICIYCDIQKINIKISLSNYVVFKILLNERKIIPKYPHF